MYLLLFLMLVIACALRADAACANETATFADCTTTREDGIECLFTNFGEPDASELETTVLFEAWDKLLPPALRKLAGSPQNIIDRCDTNRDGKFTRTELLDNVCGCMENCMWAKRVRIVCGMAERRPNWRAGPVIQ